MIHTHEFTFILHIVWSSSLNIFHLSFCLIFQRLKIKPLVRSTNTVIFIRYDLMLWLLLGLFIVIGLLAFIIWNIASNMNFTSTHWTKLKWTCRPKQNEEYLVCVCLSFSFFIHLFAHFVWFPSLKVNSFIFRSKAIQCDIYSLRSTFYGTYRATHRPKNKCISCKWWLHNNRNDNIVSNDIACCICNK